MFKGRRDTGKGKGTGREKRLKWGRRTSQEGSKASRGGRGRGRSRWGKGSGRKRGIGLQPDFEKVERVADYYSDSAAQVAGPEVGGHSFLVFCKGWGEVSRY